MTALQDGKKDDESESVSFWDACRIPGVMQYAFCLFFSKLIAYTFLYWLPYYIKSTPIEGRWVACLVLAMQWLLQVVCPNCYPAVLLVLMTLPASVLAYLVIML